jgi:hypothetical protein
MLEAEIGRSQFKASPGKKLIRTYLRKQARYSGTIFHPIYSGDG